MAASKNLTVGSNLLPKTSGNINLGDSTHKWVIDASQISGSVANATAATTATKFASNQSVTLTGDVTGSASSQAGWSVSTTLANTTVTPGSYGPTANATPAHGASFNVPQITVDAKGRVTSAATRTVKLPADADTKNTAGSTDTSSKIYLIGATSQAANPQTYSDNEVYATSGVLTTKSVQVGGTAATMSYDSTNKCINFTFA